jgi:hypothetical protein
LYALNADGSLRWRYHTGGITQSSPVVGGSGDVFIAANTNCLALNSAGSLRWQWPIVNNESSPPAQATWTALANGNVLATLGDGLLVELTGADWVWRYWLGAQAVSSPLVTSAGTVYTAGFAGNFHAIQRDVPCAKSPWPMFRGNSQRTGQARPER